MRSLTRPADGPTGSSTRNGEDPGVINTSVLLAETCSVSTTASRYVMPTYNASAPGSSAAPQFVRPELATFESALWCATTVTFSARVSKGRASISSRTYLSTTVISRHLRDIWTSTWQGTRSGDLLRTRIVVRMQAAHAQDAEAREGGFWAVERSQPWTRANPLIIRIFDEELDRGGLDFIRLHDVKGVQLAHEEDVA